MIPVQIVVVPMPVPCAGGWTDRAQYNEHPQRRRKDRSDWPRFQPIPTQETRRQLDDARRLLAERREQRAWRELESRP